MSAIHQEYDGFPSANLNLGEEQEFRFLTAASIPLVRAMSMYVLSCGMGAIVCASSLTHHDLIITTSALMKAGCDVRTVVQAKYCLLVTGQSALGCRHPEGVLSRGMGCVGM